MILCTTGGFISCRRTLFNSLLFAPYPRYTRRILPRRIRYQFASVNITLPIWADNYELDTYFTNLRVDKSSQLVIKPCCRLRIMFPCVDHDQLNSASAIRLQPEIVAAWLLAPLKYRNCGNCHSNYRQTTSIRGFEHESGRVAVNNGYIPVLGQLSISRVLPPVESVCVLVIT